MRARVLLSVLFVATGCVVWNRPDNERSDVALPPVAPDHVRIFRTADQVGARYDVVAVLREGGEASSPSDKSQFEALRQRAGARGANGIILNAYAPTNPKAHQVAGAKGISGPSVGRSLAIFVYTDEANR